MIKKIKRIAVIGLGYVGLPLAIEFGKKYNTVGYDLNLDRIKDLNNNIDNTGEVSLSNFKSSKFIKFTNSHNYLLDCNIFIVTVPTPVTKFNNPDFTFLKNASKLVSKYLSKDNLVIYESTVYPGATEEICVPILKKKSKLKYIDFNNKDEIGFYCGYSPERVNPGDKKHRLKNILKIVAGSTPQVTKFMDKLYSSIINKGTFIASSIKVAEAAKVIENTQRDINISLMNELSIICNKIGIDTNEVIDAANTKWNFINFRPGLVGGHCISVDPYYLTYKSKKIGYKPKVILSGRKINDSMGLRIGKIAYNFLNIKQNNIKNFNVLILGTTFKENCPDIRNSQTIKIFNYLTSKKINVDVYDKIASNEEFEKIYNKKLTKELIYNFYDIVIITVAHNHIKDLGIKRILKLSKKPPKLIDLKNIFDKKYSVFRL